MIPHRQEYPLRTTVCPLLADRRQACACRARAFAWSKFETMHGGRTDLEGWFRQLLVLVCFAARSGCSLQQAGRTWHREMADYARCSWWSIDHDRGARAALAQAKKFLLSQFLFLHLVVVASSLLALSSGSLLLSERMTVLVSFSRQSQTSVLQLLEPFLLVLGLKKKAQKRMVLKIDRRRVVLRSFFSPGTACNSSWRHSPSHAKPCWLVAAIHPESTTNWPETKAIEHAPPFTGHEQGGRDFDFGNVSSPWPLIWLPSCFAKQQSGHSSVIVWFCFSRKSPQKWRKLHPHRNKRQKTKK